MFTSVQSPDLASQYTSVTHVLVYPGVISAPVFRASDSVSEPLEGRKDGVVSADGDIHDPDRSAPNASQYNINHG